MMAPIDKVLDEGNCGRATDRGEGRQRWRSLPDSPRSLAWQSSHQAAIDHINIPIRVDINNQVQRHRTTTKDTKSTKESENETLNAFFQFGDAKVDQQSDLHARQFHVGQQLSLVNSLDLVNTLKFED